MDENDVHIGHETKDINVWEVGKFGIALVMLCAISLALLFGVFRYFQISDDAVPKPGVSAFDPKLTFPQPQLQTAPALDLQAIRETEDQVLSTYGWVDQSRGVVRIPVNRAIELLAQRGLPARKEAPAASSVSVPGESGLGVSK